MAPARTSGVGTRAGAGDYQGVEITRRRPSDKKKPRRHQYTGRNRIGLEVIMTEEDRRPGNGNTTPLGTGRDRDAGRGWQEGGGVQGMAEEGGKLEGSTPRGQQGH